jgi:hypothetical protein
LSEKHKKTRRFIKYSKEKCEQITIQCIRKKKKDPYKHTFLVYSKGLPMAENVRGDMRLHTKVLQFGVDGMEHEESDPNNACPIILQIKLFRLGFFHSLRRERENEWDTGG